MGVSNVFGAVGGGWGERRVGGDPDAEEDGERGEGRRVFGGVGECARFERCGGLSVSEGEDVYSAVCEFLRSGITCLL